MKSKDITLRISTRVILQLIIRECYIEMSRKDLYLDPNSVIKAEFVRSDHLFLNNRIDFKVNKNERTNECVRMSMSEND